MAKDLPKEKGEKKGVAKKNISKKELDKIQRQKRDRKLEKKALAQREKEIIKSKTKEEIKEKKDERKPEKEDEHVKDVFDKDGYLELAQEEHIDAGDEAILKKIAAKKGPQGQRNLADLIMEKMEKGTLEQD